MPAYEAYAQQGMVWSEGGTFRMGSDRQYPEEAPAHRVRVQCFWIDRTPVTNRQFREFLKATGQVTVTEIAPDPRGCPGALSHMLRAGHAAEARGGPFGLESLVGVQVRRRLAPAVRPAPLDQRAERPPGASHRLPGRGSLREVGGQGTADRGRMGVRRARRAGWRRVRLGRRVRARRPPDGEHLARRLPHENTRLDGYERTSPVTAFPPNRLRSPRHDRQRLGVDHGLVHSQNGLRVRACCIPRGGREDQSYDPPASRRSEFRAGWSKAARTCARPTTGGSTGRPRAMPSRSTAPWATSGSGAWSDTRRHQSGGSWSAGRKPCSPRV
jgi:formylglycine-generating enzyme